MTHDKRLMDNDTFELEPDNVPDIITKPKSAPLEKAVEARLVARVIAAGGKSWKFVSINNRGVSDRIVLINGRTIFVELKRDGGKMSALQKVFMRNVIDNGGEYALVEGMEGVSKFIKQVKQEDGMWKTHFRALHVLVRWFEGKV